MYNGSGKANVVKWTEIHGNFHVASITLNYKKKDVTFAESQRVHYVSHVDSKNTKKKINK